MNLAFRQHSGTTLIESIFMGIPFIILADRPSVRRLRSCVLEISVGHPEWIAHSEEEYADKAVALTSIRAGLRENVQHSSIMAEQVFARNVEHAYLQMFELWNKKEP